MSTLTWRDREFELVALMIFERDEFYAEYRRVMGLHPAADVSGVFDRDLLRAMLKQQFPTDKRAVRRW